MLDFKELPTDGVKFEQLIREILLIKGLTPHWTGKGPDHGRDIVVDEHVVGVISKFERKWLVQCKHYAHSERSVGVGDVPSLIDDCNRIGARGFLLACSTEASSALTEKLKEINDSERNAIDTEIWDSVKLEKFLLEPRTFSLAHIFFPNSMQKKPWSVYNMDSPLRWSAHYKAYFMYLGCRSSIGAPSLTEIELIVSKLESVIVGNNESLRIRAVYYDNKNQEFQVFADYLVPMNSTPSLDPNDIQEVVKDGDPLYANTTGPWYNAYFFIGVQYVLPSSDYYHLDDSKYYDEYSKSLVGLCIDKLSVKFIKNWESISKNPVIRSWADRLMFEKRDTDENDVPC